MKHTFLYLIFFLLCFSQNSQSQCFEIESILVDACGPQEGFSEMVRFRVGPDPLNTATLNVNWPNNAWQGLIQNAFTASQTAVFNAQIVNAGGCAQLIEPVGGVLPANSTVILVTSFNVSTAQNPFGAISEDIYILYQNNPTNSTGHFANFGVGIRTLSMTINGCFDIVSYDRSLLINQSGQPGAGDGATVLFDPDGTATYVNFGCFAPVPPFLVNITDSTFNECAGNSILLSATAEGHQSLLWSAPAGVFSDPTVLNPTYTIPDDATGTLELTLTATNACGNTISDTVLINVTSSITPNFPTELNLCNGETVPPLELTSPNGITGTWSPATINSSTGGAYVFTPNAGQCATALTLTVVVNATNPPTGESLQLICFSDTPTVSDLTATGTDILWYDVASGGVPLGPSSPLNECQVYFASQTLNGCESTQRFPVSVILIQSQITPSENDICDGTTVTLTVPETSFPSTPFSILDFSGNFNCNPSSPAFNGNNLLTQAQSGNFVFDGIPFFIEPWGTTLNSWSARFDSGPNPRSLVLDTDCGIISDFSLFANTYWGSSGLPSYLNVSFYNNNQLVYVKELIGDDDIRDFNNSALYTSMINNTTTINFWTSGNGNRRLDKITIPLPTPMAVDRIEINDFGDTNLQRVFVLATTVHNLSMTPTYAWSTGETTTTISVTPSETTEYWVDITVNGITCREYFTLFVTPNTIPEFTQVEPICQGDSLAALPQLSNNAILGSWSPPMNNLATTTYTFLPDAGQCATPVTMTIEVNENVVPDFSTSLILCDTDTAPPLATTSPNGISGAWSPNAIDMTSSGTYVFIPNPNQCAAEVTLTVTIETEIVPDFVTSLTLCSSDTAPSLNTTSPNGINGTWSPNAIDMTTSGTYVFTPNPNQCAAEVTLTVTIETEIVPDFVTSLTLCSNDTASSLNTTSPNGITGTWSPNAIDMTTSGTYVFIPNPNQCAAEVTLTVTIETEIVPDFVTSLTLCSSDTAPSLNTTSPNGIDGTWSPNAIDMTTSGTYVFTPNPNQCAAEVTLTVTIETEIVPDFVTSLTLCSTDTAPSLDTTSPNGITGTWSPNAIDMTTSGTYVFTPNPNQCAVEVTLTVTIETEIVPDFVTSLTLCSSDTAPFLNITSPNGITGTWSPNAIDMTTDGTYVFTPNPNQCATTTTLQVTIESITGTISGDTTLCEGETTTWTASLTGGVWSSDDPSIVTVDADGNLEAMGPGTTTLRYIVQGVCDVELSQAITVYGVPTPNLSDVFICLNPLTGTAVAPVLLESGLNAAQHTLVWSLNGDVLGTDATLPVSEPGIYSLTTTHNQTGCSGTVTVGVIPSSAAIATLSIAVDFQRNQTITVLVTGGSGDYVYQLNNGPIQSSPVFSPVPQGENTVIVRDLNGCDDVVLTIYSFNYPPFFTPNNDNYNDTWDIEGLDNQLNARLFIFDRYGKLLKQMKPSVGEGWDGTYMGAPLPSTDYWFSLFYTDRDGIEREFKAHFSLKR